MKISGLLVCVVVMAWLVGEDLATLLSNLPGGSGKKREVTNNVKTEKVTRYLTVEKKIMV